MVSCAVVVGRFHLMNRDNDRFDNLIRRVRLGEPEATAELVRRFEPEIRRKIRVWIRLRHPELRSLVETMDIYQSVVAGFLERAASGRYELDDPERVLGLLVVMARRKLRGVGRNQRRLCRDVRRTEPLPEGDNIARAEPTPSRIIAGRELLDLAMDRLSPEERRLVALRAEGTTWDEIAADLGGTAEGRRKQLTRAIERVARALGLGARADNRP